MPNNFLFVLELMIPQKMRNKLPNARNGPRSKDSGCLGTVPKFFSSSLQEENKQIEVFDISIASIGGYFCVPWNNKVPKTTNTSKKKILNAFEDHDILSMREREREIIITVTCVGIGSCNKGKQIISLKKMFPVKDK